MIADSQLAAAVTHTRSDSDDHAGGFVTWDEREAGAVELSVKDVNVGAAYSDGSGFDEDLIVSRRGLGAFLESEFARRSEGDGAHVGAPILSCQAATDGWPPRC